MILRGRVFRQTDTPGNLPVAIVNEALATTYFGGKNSIGRRITLPDGTGVFRYGALLSGTGIAVGSVAAVIARRALLGAFTTPTDLPAYLLLPLAVMLVTLIAAWGPARRAAAVEPTVALRNE